MFSRSVPVSLPKIDIQSNVDTEARILTPHIHFVLVPMDTLLDLVSARGGLHPGEADQASPIARSDDGNILVGIRLSSDPVLVGMKAGSPPIRGGDRNIGRAWRNGGARIARVLSELLDHPKNSQEGSPAEVSVSLMCRAIDAQYGHEYPRREATTGRVVSEGLLSGQDLVPMAWTDAAIRHCIIGLLVASQQLPSGQWIVHLNGHGLSASVAEEAIVEGRATALARDLSEMPSNIKSPAWLAETASEIIKHTAQSVALCASDGHTSDEDSLGGRSAAIKARGELSVHVFDERWLAKEHFGGILAVGSGSSHPPRLVQMEWRPTVDVGSNSDEIPHIVLIGKGITFDTGGISIKPAAAMGLMRTDMSGGAAVIAAMRGVAELGLNAKVSALVPCAENMISGSAYRPGDVITHRGGTTTEVGNTDAEGRMVLADAMVYAAQLWSPDITIDLATLTGAAKIALGVYTAACYSTDDDLAKEIIDAGATVGESLWRLPLDQALKPVLHSHIADIKQAPSGPGSITAALFLQHFVDPKTRWAHLDIAGPARADVEFDEVSPVAAGFAARTLVELLRSIAHRGSSSRVS